MSAERRTDGKLEKMNVAGPAAPAYCGACGTKLNAGAKFCRSCGSATPLAAQRPAPPAPGGYPPPSGMATHAGVGGNPLAAWLAIIGGAAMCFITLYAIFYFPLHNEEPVNWGQAVRFFDLLALGSGIAAIAIGVLTLKRPGNDVGRGIWLALAGAPTLIVALLWAFWEPLHLTIYPLPFYFAYVFFTDIGVAHIGSAYVPVPLVLACAMVVVAGVLLTAPSRRPVPPRP